MGRKERELPFLRTNCVYFDTEITYNPLAASKRFKITGRSKQWGWDLNSNPSSLLCAILTNLATQQGQTSEESQGATQVPGSMWEEGMPGSVGAGRDEGGTQMGPASQDIRDDRSGVW